MPWITNICRAVRFAPWPHADKLASAVLNDHNTLLPETREFLDFYLPNDSYCDDLLSTADSDSTSRTSLSLSLSSSHTSSSIAAAVMDPLDSLELLLAATSPENPHFPTVRSHPVCSEFGHDFDPSLPPPSRVVTVAPHLAVYPPRTQLPAVTLPILSVHTAPPATALLPDGTRASSTRAVAASLNALFADERNADPSRRDIPAAQAAMRAIARTVTQALLSRSGCAGLTNGAHALLFQVDDGSCERSFVTVRVSRAFGVAETRSAPPAAMHALAGLARHSIALLRKDAKLAARIRRCAVTVGSTQTECVFEERVPVRGWRLGRGGWEDENVGELIRRHRGVIGMGSSGVVLESVLDRRRVAVKLWNETDLDGLRDLWDEIEMYKKVMAKHGSVAGFAVPRMVVARDGAGADTVLVTELVGMGLKRGDEGVLMIGHGPEWDFVEPWEEANIVKAARESLVLLHECGIAHGDVCLENVRVDRRRTFRGWLWHAWWVDLGHAEDECATDGGDEFGIFQFELDRVERLLEPDG